MDPVQALWVAACNQVIVRKTCFWRGALGSTIDCIL